MNKQSLYVFGSALLATTALTTGAQSAALIKDPILANAGAPATTAIVAKSIASEIFSTTVTTADAKVFGAAATTLGTASGSDILIDFALPLTLGYRVELSIAGASFSGSPTVTAYQQTTTGTASMTATSASGCTVQVQPDKLLIYGCDPTRDASLKVDAMNVAGISYTAASGLATNGASITLSGMVKDTSGTITFDNITAAAVVTSKSVVDAAFAASTGVSIDSSSTPSFSKLTGAATTTQAVLGSLKYSMSGALGTDLSTAFLASSIMSTTEIKVTHGVLLDDALTSIEYVTDGGTSTSKISTAFVGSTVSFTTTTASLNGAFIRVNFDGTSLIDTTTSTATAVVTPTVKTASQGSLARIGALTGNLAQFSRGGLSAEINTVNPTAGTGSTLYRSFIRIANQSVAGGIATITVKNDVTGAAIGSFTTAAMTSAITAGLLTSAGEIRANSTFQISAADIEANTTGAAATGQPYKVTITGPFNGYVQNLMWNSTTGLFQDLSSFRNGTQQVDP